MADVWEWSDTCHTAYGLQLDEGYSAGTSFYALEAVYELSHLDGTLFSKVFFFKKKKKIGTREFEHRRR